MMTRNTRGPFGALPYPITAEEIAEICEVEPAARTRVRWQDIEVYDWVKKAGMNRLN